LHTHPKALAGIALLMIAVACFATLDTTTKLVTAHVPLVMALWFRYFVQAVGTTAWVWRSQGRDRLTTRHPGLHLIRGTLLFLVTILAFGSLRFLPVGEFTAIVMTTPLFVTLLASRMLGEHVSLARVLLVCGGFLGTLTIVRPGGDAFGWALLLPLCLVIANTAFQLMTSRMTRTENTMTIQFYTGWVGVALASVPLYWFWAPVEDWRLWAGLVIMGVTGGSGHLFLVMAFERAPAATLMPFMYAQIGFGMLGSWLIFDHIPDHWSLIGIGLIALCGVAGGVLTLFEGSKRRLHEPSSKSHRNPSTNP
jgi:drug/metabolite transporter (DMT)-like permease